MSYSDEIIEKVKAKNPNEPEFIQAVTEVMNSLRLVVDNDPKYQNEALLERIVEPERIIMFRVPWVDDEDFQELPDRPSYRRRQGRF